MGNYLSHFASRLHLEFSMEDVEDYYGKFTRFSNSEEHKPNILYFAISDTELIKNRIKYFNVSHFTSISDHCCIKLSLDVDYNIPVP